jgi:CheY-like chemotaxis protein
MDASTIIQAATGLLWPLLVTAVVLRLLPEIKKILKSRAFTVKVGGVEIDVQQAVDKLVKSTAELQARDTGTTQPSLEGTPSPAGQDTSPRTTPEARTVIKRILWVDDKPTNNAYETAQLQALGVGVQNALSTQEAMDALHAPGADFDVIISDMGRQEGPGPYNTRAGLDLIQQVRARDITIPIVIYAGSSALALQDDVKRIGGVGVATGDRKLFELLRQVGDFPQ